MATINFRNELQKILWECELSGQISDGMWENARPYNHYRPWGGAHAKIHPGNLGCDFWAEKRNYNFLAKDLLDVVGERMVWAMNLADYDMLENMEGNYAPNYGFIRQYYHWCDSWTHSTDPYFVRGKESIISRYGSMEEFDRIRKTGPHTMKSLRKELKDMKEIIRMHQK